MNISICFVCFKHVVWFYNLLNTTPHRITTKKVEVEVYKLYLLLLFDQLDRRFFDFHSNIYKIKNLRSNLAGLRAPPSARATSTLEAGLVFLVYVNVLRFLALPAPFFFLDGAVCGLEETSAVFGVLIPRSLKLAAIAVMVGSFPLHLVILPLTNVNLIQFGPVHHSEAIALAMAPVAGVEVSILV